jgi:iron(III) transport system substrate-binding protein
MVVLSSADGLRISIRVFRTAFALAAWLVLTSCARQSAEVVVYASQDQIYAEPILREFSRGTGIKAKAAYDSEAVKTVGLVNRLLAEKSNPQGDVFWSNEALRTHQLAERGVLEKWGAFGYRSRRIVVNTNLLPLVRAPKSLAALTNAEWRGKIALAYPVFGTTAAHFLALRRHWGVEHWESWCRALQSNKPLIVDGNSVVVRFVGRGEAWIGLTDSDDIAAGQRAGLPVTALPLTDESLLIPNTVAVIRGARNPAAAQALFDYLQTPVVIDRLVAAQALEGATPPNQSLTVNWREVARDLEAGTTTLLEVFVRH